MQVSLGDLLAKALEAEFGGLIRAVEPNDWLDAANGVITKMDAALQTPKRHPIQYTDVEVNLVDMALQAMGWEPEKRTRVDFLRDISEVLRARQEG